MTGTPKYAMSQALQACQASAVFAAGIMEQSGTRVFWVVFLAFLNYLRLVRSPPLDRGGSISMTNARLPPPPNLPTLIPILDV